jgi:hypothetical protein
VYSGQLRIIFDFQVANRSAVGEGGSHRESSLLPIGHLRVICDSQLQGYAIF